MFRRNVGGVDRVLRLTLGGILLLVGLFLLAITTRLGLILAAVGLLSLLTGIFRFCVLYTPFHISTGQPEEQPLAQVCNCAAWTEAVRDRATAAAPPGSTEKKKEVAEATTAARGR
jgi:hypothetical protein